MKREGVFQSDSSAKSAQGQTSPLRIERRQKSPKYLGQIQANSPYSGHNFAFRFQFQFQSQCGAEALCFCRDMCPVRQKLPNLLYSLIMVVLHVYVGVASKFKFRSIQNSNSEAFKIQIQKHSKFKFRSIQNSNSEASSI